MICTDYNFREVGQHKTEKMLKSAKLIIVLSRTEFI